MASTTKTDTFIPSEKVLSRYADVLVNYALNSGRGVKKGEVVLIQVPECAKPMLYHLREKIMKAGGFVMTDYLPDDYSRGFFELANEGQLKFFPEKYLKAKVDTIDHSILILAETNKRELEGIDPKKIMTRQAVFKKYKDWRDEKENSGKFTWTLALYGTHEMAKEAKMSLKEYWEQIIKACFLDKNNPVDHWKNITKEIERLRKKLNSLKIQRLKIKANGTDLTVVLGENREWLAGSGRNIPSFEIFISPDFRGTQGKVYFNQPLYRYGSLIKDVRLEFKNGKVIKSLAKTNQNLLQEMIKVKNADRIGEFSLTDSRFSRISRFMGETLYDENAGGKYGNFHIALGSAYKDSFPGDPSKVKEKEWEKMGYNDSVVHTDIVSTDDRVVTATLKDKKELVIYKEGKFTI